MKLKSAFVARDAQAALVRGPRMGLIAQGMTVFDECSVRALRILFPVYRWTACKRRLSVRLVRVPSLKHLSLFIVIDI